MKARFAVGCVLPFTRRLLCNWSCKVHIPYFATSSISPLQTSNSRKMCHILLGQQKYVSPLLKNCQKDAITKSVDKCRNVSRKTYPFCELKEEDLDEDFVRGSGPGGQSVNQTANCVVLKHKPTGIVVKCHETRSLQTNRQRARERLKERIDFHLHGSQSFLALQEKESSLLRREKKKKNKSRLDMKKAFKEREGIE